MRQIWRRVALLVVVAVSVVGPTATQSSPTAQQPIALGVINGTVTRAGSTEGLASVVVSVEVPAQRMRALLDAAAAGATNIPAALLEAARRTPIPGQATNDAISIRVTTGASGQFTVTVPEGPVIVSAKREDYFGPVVLLGGFASSVSEPVVVSAKQPVVVRLELIPGGTISGRVIDPGGRPMPRVKVFTLGRGYSWNGVPALSPRTARRSSRGGTAGRSRRRPSSPCRSWPA
jgi:hypothetical protein